MNSETVDYKQILVISFLDFIIRIKDVNNDLDAVKLRKKTKTQNIRIIQTK